MVGHKLGEFSANTHIRKAQHAAGGGEGEVTMEVHAILRKRADVGAKIGPRGGAANPGPPGVKAQAVLQFVPRKGARLVAKTLNSAIANAENNNKLKPESLRIKEAVTGTATSLKRFTPKARGSAGPIIKRRCHVKITLSDE